jgi:ABC-type Mn2+/Zn2+ transport system permease subunit
LQGGSGPLIAFGFLLIPPLVSRQFARSIEQFAVIASALGGVTALAGFYVAYRWDLPVGPTDVVLLGVVYALAFVGVASAGVRGAESHEATRLFRPERGWLQLVSAWEGALG